MLFAGRTPHWSERGGASVEITEFQVTSYLNPTGGLGTGSALLDHRSIYQPKEKS